MEDKALEYCIEVYEQYTRAEINNFHGSIIRCWKVGKRASAKPKSETPLLDQLESGPWPSFVSDMKNNATKFHPNCYHCHHQSAIVGCDYRVNDVCDGETKYEPRKIK